MPSTPAFDTDDPDEELRDWVDENHDLLIDVIRHGEDPFARACALIALKHGTDTDVDVDELTEALG